MREGAVGRAAEAGAINQARMAEAVEKEDIPASRKRLQCSRARGMAAAENEGRLRVFEGRQFFLQIRMRRLRAGDETGGPGAGAEIACRLRRRLDDPGVRSEAEVVVGRKIVQRFVAEADHGSGGGLGNTPTAKKAAVFQFTKGLLQKFFKHAAGIL